MKKKAIQFYKEIENEQDKYKLINGLFIVKYLDVDNEISYYIGDFLKSGSASNKRKTNLVLIQPNNKLLYNKKRGLATTSLGVWKPLGISFNEKPIKEILN
jgi:hypothetical protein